MSSFTGTVIIFITLLSLSLGFPFLPFSFLRVCVALGTVMLQAVDAPVRLHIQTPPGSRIRSMKGEIEEGLHCSTLSHRNMFVEESACPYLLRCMY